MLMTILAGLNGCRQWTSPVLAFMPTTLSPVQQTSTRRPACSIMIGGGVRRVVVERPPPLLAGALVERHQAGPFAADLHDDQAFFDQRRGGDAPDRHANLVLVVADPCSTARLPLAASKQNKCPIEPSE